MSGIIGLIVTLAMLALLMYGIMKKYDTMLLLLAIGTIVLVLFSVVTGTSPLGEATIGSVFLDCFEVIRTSSESMLAGTGLVVMSVMGYVSYMSYIKASDLFAMVLSKPLKKINKPYVIATATIVVGALIKLVIPAGSSMTALTLATIYPVLIAAGVTVETASAALVLATFVVWGPAESLIYWIFSIVGLEDVAVAPYFVQYQIPIVALMMLSLVITFPLTSKLYDKKEGAIAVSTAEDADIDPKSLGLPMFYAVLPLLPLIFVLIFSELIMKSIVLSIVAANFLSFFLAVIIHMIVRKNVKDVFNESIEFFKGIGNVTGTIVFFFVTGTVFATAMEKVGGLLYLVNILVGMGGNWITLTVIGCILFTLIIAFTGALEGSIYLFAPLFLEIAQATGGNLLIMITCMIFSAGIGFSICPVSLTNIMVAGETKIPIFRLVKREIIPMVVALAVMLVSVFLILA